MKIRMTADYSDRVDHPLLGNVLDVLEVLYEGCEIESYRCGWKDDDIYVYPYECEEVK